MTGRAVQIIPAGLSCNFIIRAYGRQELACMYFPMSSPRSAWRRLKGWIMLNPRLREALAPTGSMNLLRTLTPREVRMVLAFVPFEDGIGIQPDRANAKTIYFKCLDGRFAFNIVSNINNLS